MAFNSNVPRLEFTATSGQTEFVFNFKIFNASDIVVYQTPTGQVADDTTDILTETTDYTVVIDGDDGGTVTLTSGATLNDSITLLRDLPFTRETDYQTGGDLLESTLDEDQDYQTYLSQQLESSKDRFLSIPASVQSASASLPSPVSDAYFKWSADALSIENDTTIPDAVTTSAANASAAAASATQAELLEWEAEAERLTADSYATEAEDTLVNLVTSDGDGTFTYTPTADYSALHWAAKAATFNPLLYAPLASPALTGTPTAPTAVAGTNTTQLATTAFVPVKLSADGLALVKNSNGLTIKNQCTAWVNFDGTTTPPTIRDSFNVSDVVRTATGVYDIYFTEDMENVNYTASGMGASSKGLLTSGTKAVDTISISNTRTDTSALVDYSRNSISIFGGKN